MIELRTAIQNKLKDIHTRVYFQVAPEDAEYPYIVYDLPNSYSDGEGFENFTLDIDGWDINNSGDTTTIENLMKNINLIDKQSVVNEKIAVTFFLENKLSLTDIDTRIKRRKYTYQVKLFRRD